jgi:anaerobic ribonucleoside-triphosphate reductase activating protein
MHYGQIITTDTANGTGVRLSLFVSGCTNHCEGCFQPQTWDFCYGKPYTQETEDHIIQELSKPYYDGITILGGEPMELENQPVIYDLLTKIKEKYPDKNIWLYTGFILDKDLVKNGRRYIPEITPKLISKIDVLVDGPFDITK